MLYPAPLRDLLLELAASGIYRARWTRDIHAEWTSKLLLNRRDLTRQQLDRTRALMDRAVEGSLVEGYEELIAALELPDPSDRHVLAAAIHSGSDAIVTYNLKDFPAEVLGRYELEVLHPDDFLFQQVGLDGASVVLAARRCRARLTRPAISAPDYLAILKSQSLPLLVAELSDYVHLI